MTTAVSPALSGAAVTAFVLVDIVIILVVARLLGRLATRVGQPRVLGEILAGVLLGPTLLGRSTFAWDAPWPFLSCPEALAASGLDPSITACLFPPQAQMVLGVLGQIALMLYMFLVGLEVDWDALRGRAVAVSGVAAGAMILPVAGGFAIAPMLYDGRFVAGFGTAAQPSRLAFSLMVGAMLSVTAFPVMARILQEKGMGAGKVGSVGIAAAAVVTVLMFLTVSAASGVASGAGTAELLGRLGAAVAYVVGMFTVVRSALRPLGRRYEENARRLHGGTSGTWSEREAGVGGPLTTEMFAGIIILVFVSAALAHVLGLTVIMGGFLAGAVMPVRKDLVRDMTAELFDVVAVVLLPVFLAFSGLQTDFTLLRVEALPGIALFLVAGVLTKWWGGALSGRLAGLSWPEGNALGILLNCRGMLVLVVALIAIDAGVITAPLQIGAVLMALVTTAMTGPLFDVARRRLAPAA